MKNLLFKLFLFISFPLLASTPNHLWEKDVLIKSPRENIYSIPSHEYEKVIMAGRRHALIYPVSVSQLKIPYAPLKTFFESRPDDQVRKVLYELVKVVSPFKSMNEVYKWLGLHAYPLKNDSRNPNPFPEISKKEKELPLGATLMKSSEGEALTFGCATCHVGDLFGVKVLGLTNRFPRANEFFRQGALLAPYVNSFLFKELLLTTEGERQILVEAKKNLRYIGTKSPVSIGLDTSLAQVALSLSKREQDEFASRTLHSRLFPRKNALETQVADSKPAVWWNLKYKNRWLSDGSIVSGNPVHTNFLWNEIGRGTDLKELEKWLLENNQTIKELTAAVFASKAPRYEDFFGAESIDIEMAQRGEMHFIQSCQKCHGTYQKGWDFDDEETLSMTEKIQTIKVTYPEKTPVIDVGTDPGRYLGMKAFAEDLNRLKISKAISTRVEPQKGYVPPPLVGIWARWPYFHNNSIPNLCALLTVQDQRPAHYYAGPAVNQKTDFDQDCVGYPMGEKTPKAWMNNPEFLYDSTKEGLSNSGHDQKIFIKDGKEIYSAREKRELIEFLKTL